MLSTPLESINRSDVVVRSSSELWWPICASRNLKGFISNLCRCTLGESKLAHIKFGTSPRPKWFSHFHCRIAHVQVFEYVQRKYVHWRTLGIYFPSKVLSWVLLTFLIVIKLRLDYLYFVRIYVDVLRFDCMMDTSSFQRWVSEWCSRDMVAPSHFRVV